MDVAKGKLHLIDDDLDLWLPNVVTIMLAGVSARLEAEVAFATYLRLRDEATESGRAQDSDHEPAPRSVP